MSLVLHCLASFVAAAAFGILFNAPRRTLLQCGISGMLGWAAYYLLAFPFGAIFATVSATFIVGLVSLIFARVYKEPVILFSVSGIIPLVPGGLAYDAMRNFVENKYDIAVQLAAQAFLISGSIAIGLILSEVMNQVVRSIPLRRGSRL